ncbi:MAG: phosphoglycerate kinase [Candidatus Taylorbacteria bacterium]|nr:phosphoglycerate kinase [Candidatus Taylorbacteria bacterium]
MLHNIHLLRNISSLKGKRVLLRIDLNLPIVGGEVRDDFRIKRILPTLEFLKSKGAVTTIISHIESEETKSLEIVAEYLKKIIKLEFVRTFDEAKLKIPNLKSGEFILLENLRLNPGEIANDLDFAKKLATLGDLFVNDAFSVSHRSHSSIVGIPKFLPSFAGLLFEDEVSGLSRVFNPPRPFLFILAGAKFETKFPLVKKFMKVADTVFIGGALSNDLFKAKGYEIGLSKHSDANFGFKGILGSSKLVLPVDVEVESGGKRIVKGVSEILPKDASFDSGPVTIETLREKISTAKFVLWNGTLGRYESGYEKGTENLTKILASSGVETVVGGGDTIAVISSLGLLDKFSFVSTGGGAMLDFLADETLPGIEALRGDYK